MEFNCLDSAEEEGKQKWRLVIDYRKVNEKTITDKCPIPNINKLLLKLGKCMYFTTVDLASGFHQIEMKPKDIPKTVFKTFSIPKTFSVEGRIKNS